MKGFTLAEVLIVVGILIVLTGISIPAFHLFQTGSDLTNAAEQIVGVLRLARSKAISSEGSSRWGVYFSTSTAINYYTLFKGASYGSRATSSDQSYNLPLSVRMTTPLSEVVFERITGQALSSGAVSLGGGAKNIYIASSGQIDSATSTLPSDQSRLKDSRHVHFDYSRPIATSSEKIILIFTLNGATTSQEIVIADNLVEGQVFWEGQVNALGQTQALKIHTHNLNSPDSRFSINRDMRYNTEALEIKINGDATGDLIRYNASGTVTTAGTSIYVLAPVWQ